MVWDKTVIFATFNNTNATQQPNTDGPVQILKGHTDGVHCVYVYKDRIYSASYDKSVKIWEKEVLSNF
jgi:WD40 repeat protein